jgi:hypothetical protein
MGYEKFENPLRALVKLMPRREAISVTIAKQSQPIRVLAFPTVIAIGLLFVLNAILTSARNPRETIALYKQKLTRRLYRLQ